MAAAYTITVNGITFALLTGMGGKDDGVVVDPTIDITILKSEVFINALAMAIEIYPDFESYTDLEMVAHEYGRNSNERSRQYHLQRETVEELEAVIATYQTLKAADYINIPEYIDTYIEDIYGEIKRRSIRDATKKQAEEKKQERLQAKPGYVYLIRSISGYFKIGRTTNPKDRMKTFAVKLPFEVEYEAVIQTPDMYLLESQLHQRFAQNRINGEWFNLTSDDVSYIKSLVVQ